MFKRPSLNEIDTVLRNDLQPHFAELEADRKNVVFLLALTAIGVAASLGLMYFLMRRFDADLLSAAVMLPIGAGGYFVARAKKRFSGRFKEMVMRKVAARFFPTLAYDPERIVSKNFYDESDLFRKELSTYSGNDFFSGKLGEVDFQFSELLCQYTTGSGKKRQTHTAFRGFFFIGDFHREIYFRTQIQPDLAEAILGILGRGLQRVGNNGRLVDLEDPEFEKLFVVTSDDQVEARYILTPAFMEKLRDFRARVDNNIHLCFVNGRMMLAIETHHDYFEPNLFGEILARRDLMKFIDMLLLLVGVAQEFLHHPKFAAQPPKMPVPPPLTAAQKLKITQGNTAGGVAHSRERS